MNTTDNNFRDVADFQSIFSLLTQFDFAHFRGTYHDFYCFFSQFYNMIIQSDCDELIQNCKIDFNQEAYLDTMEYSWFTHYKKDLLNIKKEIEQYLLVEIPLILFYEFATTNYDLFIGPRVMTPLLTDDDDDTDDYDDEDDVRFRLKLEREKQDLEEMIKEFKRL